jgi:purine catabolism regulator
MLRLSDFLALAPVAAGEPRVLAGATLLERDVRWAHVFESADVAELLEGGEVMLTTGLELREMPADRLTKLVDDLSTVPVAAIALELGSHLPAAPEALVAAASRAGLPLIVFTRRVRFVEITHAVAEVQMAEEVSRLRSAVGVQARLRVAARDGHGAAAILTELGEALGAQLVVERLDGTPLMSAPPDVGLSAAFLDALDAARRGEATPLLSRSVVIPGRGAARLHALLPAATELDELTITEAAFLLGAALAGEPRLDELLADDRARAVRSLAEGRGASAGEVRRRLRSVGLDVRGDEVTVFVARGVRIDELRERLGGALLEAVGARTVRGLVTGSPAWDPVAGVVGLARTSLEPWAVRSAFDAAARASLAAVGLGRPLLDAASAGAADPIAAAVLAGRRLVAPLSARDERLLDALVRSGFSVAPAARLLGVSRQAVYNELRRAEGRLGIPLGDPAGNAEASLTLLAHRMQVAIEGDA